MSNSSAYLLFKHRRALWEAARNEMRARYAGSFLGFGWAVVAPLLLLIIYASVYLVVLKVQVPSMPSLSYVVYIFAGLTPFLSVAEALSMGVSSIIANKAVLNSTVFPIDLVPAKAVLTSQVTMIVGIILTLIGAAIAGTLSWTVLLLPIVWALQIIALIGLNWILSLFNVVFRDLQNIISPVLMMLLIASPIAYTPDMVPPGLTALIILNPLAYFIRTYQYIIVLGKLPGPLTIVALFVIAIGLFLMGNWLLTRARRVIADYV